MIIRPEASEDAEILFTLTQRAFSQMPYSDGSEGRILNDLRSDGDLTLSLVAEDGGTIVGHVAFSPVRINDIDRGWFGLGPISVAPERQREGIGRKLVDAGLSILEQRGASGCALIGDPALYSKLGFRCNKRLTYGEVPPEVVQFKTLSGQDPEGQLTFAPAFDPKP